MGTRRRTKSETLFPGSPSTRMVPGGPTPPEGGRATGPIRGDLDSDATRSGNGSASHPDRTLTRCDIGDGTRWHTVVVFDVPGDPIAQPRHRSDERGRIYTPGTADAWKDQVRASCVEALALTTGVGSLPGDGPFLLGLEFRFARPKSHWRTGRYAGRLRDRAPRFHTQKPDFDNLAKAATDALGAWKDLPPLVWFDDAAVVGSYVVKSWAGRGERSGVRVVISRWEP